MCLIRHSAAGQIEELYGTFFKLVEARGYTTETKATFDVPTTDYFVELFYLLF